MENYQHIRGGNVFTASLNGTLFRWQQGNKPYFENLAEQERYTGIPVQVWRHVESLDVNRVAIAPCVQLEADLALVTQPDMFRITLLTPAHQLVASTADTENDLRNLHHWLSNALMETRPAPTSLKLN